MPKKAFALWKKEGKKGTTLQGRLFLFFISVSVSLVLIFTLLMVFFGITGRQEQGVQSHLSTELSIIADEIEGDFGRISLGGLAMAEDIADKSEIFFREMGIKPDELQQHPELIEPLLREHMQILISTINNRYCGGVFVMLDATVACDAENSEYAKAGVFLKKTLPTATSAMSVDIHCLRGPAQLARENNIMLIGQWHMEYDISGQDFFTQLMQTARDNPELELSRLYYWSGRVTLKDNSEAGFLLCVPLRSDDGAVFGLCGIEVSDRLFKSLYTPEGGDFENIFTVMAPAYGNGIFTSRGLIAGNSYLTGERWDYDLDEYDQHEGFVHYSGGKELYGGKTVQIRLYPSGSPYEQQSWSTAVLMPLDMLHKAVEGKQAVFIWIVAVLLAVSMLCSLLISRRYIRPVSEALNSIRTASHQERKSTAYAEINDLFEFLAAKDKEHEQKLTQLHGEKAAVETQYEQAQTYITHLVDERMPEVNEDDFKMFLRHLHTLTPKEREIFDYYMAGKKAKEILELSSINTNTLKYHNKNIYSKLGVTSRKQLLEFAALMKYGVDGK